jgi:acyl-CoA reductase-like NAD-dependent aldehyde dehydrogenase
VPGWGWAIALVCGDGIVWKPSELTLLVSIAAQQLFHDVTNRTEAEGVFSLVAGPGPSIGETLIGDVRRRQTCTVNYGADLPLAQGVQFDIGE